MIAPSICKKKWVRNFLSPLLERLGPGRLLSDSLSFRQGMLEWNKGRVRLGPGGNLYLVGAGKGSAEMAVALEKILGEAIDGGLVVTKYGYRLRPARIRMVEAGHPIPDASGERAAEEIIDLAAKVRRNDLLIGLWSGGGSALLPAPVDGISLSSKRKITDLLLKSGATIDEINTVRKHLSRLKGGRLAQLARHGTMINFILSDVVGDRLDVIASGPTAPDPTSFSDAIGILKEYRLWTEADRSIRSHLKAGEEGRYPETPKPREPFWRRIKNVLIGNGQIAVAEAARQIGKIGFRPRIVTSSLQGEAREAAKILVAIAKEERSRRGKREKPICLIAGGELTVTVRGGGKGGRCQEFALSAAMALSGLEGFTAAAFSTDGTDGPTDAAGAVSNGRTVRRAALKGRDARRDLNENNSYPFFDALGDLIRTGPTYTHLNDLYLILIE